MKNEPPIADGPDLKPVIRQLAWFTGCYLFFLIGYLGSNQDIHFWFQTLIRPAWSPPGWLVIPCWVLAYGSLASGAWPIFSSPQDRSRTIALIALAVQLVLSALWPWLFYHWHLGIWTIVGSSMMVVAACTTTTLFWRASSKSGGLALPFMFWAIYLAILNIVVFQLNR